LLVWLTEENQIKKNAMDDDGKNTEHDTVTIDPTAL
jgi:membrane-bound lytic murein transglycosylase F